jgi:pyridoxal 5'-phosphate synthase pdxT subunit
MTTIGILALQGCVTPHLPHLKSLNVQVREVRQSEDFVGLDGLILPGGESTTMLTLLQTFSLSALFYETILKIPVWGICAGAILIAKKVSSPQQKSFELLNMTMVRNGYGRQNESFVTTVQNYPVSFIRAPIITQTGKEVEILAYHQESPIWVRSGKVMATTFHPELTPDYPSPMHTMFLEIVNQSKQ